MRSGRYWKVRSEKCSQRFLLGVRDGDKLRDLLRDALCRLEGDSVGDALKVLLAVSDDDALKVTLKDTLGE